MSDSASNMCKSAGLASVRELAGYTGISTRTLNNWHKHKPRMFKLMIIAAVSIKHGEVMRELL